MIRVNGLTSSQSRNAPHTQQGGVPELTEALCGRVSREGRVGVGSDCARPPLRAGAPEVLHWSGGRAAAETRRRPLDLRAPACRSPPGSPSGCAGGQCAGREGAGESRRGTPSRGRPSRPAPHQDGGKAPLRPGHRSDMFRGESGVPAPPQVGSIASFGSFP